MPNKLMWKWILILGCLILSVWLLYPSVEWYTKPRAEAAKLEAAGLRPKRILNLGLDLRGGTHLILELDVAKLDKKEGVQEAMERAIEIIRNRVDQYGVGETPISRQGDRWISVQMPGVTDPQQAEELIGKTALLEFRSVDSGEKAQAVLAKVAGMESPFDDKGNLLAEVAKELPPNTLLFRNKDKGYSVLFSTVVMTGALLKDARVETGGEMGYPYISFNLNPQGAKVFDVFTTANIGKYLAIVLDGTVFSAPVIKGRIPNGSGIIEGPYTLEEAKNLAIVLRAGALPAPVTIIERRTMGPSLGEDSIKAGVKAALIGLIFVAAFMILYYRAAGFVADIALTLNFLFLLAAMSYFSATLTLPGIAGVLLSLAMAVDANVLILERMREEIQFGKPVAMCVPAGYDKAWSAIFDSNLTTWIAAVFLFQFGSGPVKGFAVTLTLGLLIGMFTSVFITRAVYEFWLTSNPKELSI